MQRRRFLLGAGTAAFAALSGCAGSDGDESNEGSDSTGTAASDDPNGTGSGAESSDAYSVSMEPVGEVSFDAVPESWLVYESGYADMGVALGRADGLLAVGNPPRYHTRYYDELDGVSVNLDEITSLLGDSFQIDKELFYELDADVHLVDPNWLTSGSGFGLEQSDIDEIDENVGPFFGNTVFRRTDTSWHDYSYYTMYEVFEKVAEVFQETERYEAFRQFHDDYVERVRSELPDPDERPSALLTFGNGDQPEEFSPYRLTDEGTNKKQFRDLGVGDALEGTGIDGLSTSDRGTIDYETMLEVDPEVLLVRGHEEKTAEEFENTVLAFMEEHDVASELRAVREGDVFRGGPIYQGPIQHLFTLERAATELFPDAFSGELFDRDEVASIVAGDA